MPVQTPQWCDLLCCCICYNVFDGVRHQPISLVCGHTACRSCLLKLKTKQCPFDQSAINIGLADLPQNMAILRILDSHEQVAAAEDERSEKLFETNDLHQYRSAVGIFDSLASYLKRAQSEKGGSVWSPQLSRPMQRKLVTLLCCQLVEPEGRGRALKAVRSLGERSLMELLLLHQNPYHLSSNLWAAVRARGCQFLGPAMQEEVLKLVLLALAEGVLISRKVLVMYIVQTLEKEYPQASKTSVGHVVQLLYRASCFNVIKRDGESSLMQLKEEFRTYEALRREHDAQIVQIAMEAGLRISPDQWSALLYGDQAHKSHMQSIIDRLQTPQSFVQSIQELLIGLQRTGDPGGLVELRPHYESLAEIDATQGETVVPSWQAIVESLLAVKSVVDGQARFCERYGGNRNQRESIERSVVAYKFKTSMCRDIGESKTCPRGESCTFAHSLEEMERYRARSRLMGYRSNVIKPGNGAEGNGDSSGGHDGSHSDNEYDFSIDESDFYDGVESRPKGPLPLQHQLGHRQSPVIHQTPMAIGGIRQQQQQILQQQTPPSIYGQPSAYQGAEDGSPQGSMMMNSPPQPTYGPPGVATVMMPWPPGATIVNTPNGPIALGATHPGPMPLGTTVRYQVFRQGVPCGPTHAPPTQPLPPPVPVTPAPPDYGYYWYPQAGMQPRPAGMYPGEVLHLEVPLARVAMPNQMASATQMAGPSAASYQTASAFPDMPSVPPPNQVAPQPSVTPFGNFTFAQGDPTTLYFYPPQPEHHAAVQSTGQFGVFIASPQMEPSDMVLFPPPQPNGLVYQSMDGMAGQQLQQQQDFHQAQWMSTINNGARQTAGTSMTTDTKNVLSTSTSLANAQVVVASSSSRTALSSFGAPSSISGYGGGRAAAFNPNKEDAEKHSRLIQLEMKKYEIMKCLSSIKKEVVTYTKSQPAVSRGYPTHSHGGGEDSSYNGARRSSSDSDPADMLSVSIATSVLQDDYPIINYAAAVLRGRQGQAAIVGLQSPAASNGISNYSSSESEYWSSTHTSTVSSPSTKSAFVPPSSVNMPVSGGGLTLKRSASAAASAVSSVVDYSPWKSSSGSIGGATSWTQAKNTASNGTSTTMSKNMAMSGYKYATRPYIPDEYIDIKHLSDDILRKELEQLPQKTKRAHYVRLELEAREADAWRSEDDQVIPFSNCGPQVSRYGPISRAGQRMQQASVLMSSPMASMSAAPTEMVVQVKDILHQPLPTAAVQPTKDQPVVSRADVDPSQFLSSIPQVFKATASIDPSTVDEKLDKLVDVKSKLACIPLEEGTSSAEKEQLKLELQLINKEISLLDKHTGEEYLLKALENVNLTIEELQQQP